MRFLKNVIISAIMICAASSAMGAPISFFHLTGAASGTLNGARFDVNSVLITASGDTETVGSFGAGEIIIHNQAQILIPGLGRYTFEEATVTFVNNDLSTVGFGLAPGAGTLDLLSGPFNPVFETWDMTTGMSTTFGPALYRGWDRIAVQTSGGLLAFDTDTTGGAFSARVLSAAAAAAVPLPAGLGLFFTGLLSLLLLRQRRD